MSRFIKMLVVFYILQLSTGCVLVRQHNEKYLQEMGVHREKFETLFTTIHENTDCFVYVTSGYRSTEKQQKLYDQNNKNAKPGTSPHEFQIAMDLNLICNGDWIVKADSKETWEQTKVPQLAKDLGFRWGGDFKNYHDPVHFEISK